MTIISYSIGCDVQNLEPQADTGSSGVKVQDKMYLTERRSKTEQRARASTAVVAELFSSGSAGTTKH